MAQIARCWEMLGDFFRRRPLLVIGILIATGIIIASLSYTVSTANHNKASIDEVRSAFCRADGSRISPDQETDQIRKCQALLTRLLEHPTPTQARRLREIVKEAP